jgi:hypothetical protein
MLMVLLQLWMLFFFSLLAIKPRVRGRLAFFFAFVETAFVETESIRVPGNDSMGA